ncbi:MAG: MBL fold metallo-hydrolase [Phycisphaerae bacterium]|nr:MBL fold metallo-hydrolase [Phycisphaerae bacterium]
MKIKWFGHSAFLITSDEGCKIIIDPYRYKAFELGYEKITEEAQIVVISHDHNDHDGVKELPGSPTIVRGEGVKTIGRIEFKGIVTSHEDKDLTPNTVWCFTVDGVRLCHLGDLGCSFECKLRELTGGVDVLMIPVGSGKPTLSVEAARRVVEKIKPRIVIPMHYRVPGKCDWEDVHPVDCFLVHGNNVRRLSCSEAVFSKDRLPEVTEIFVFEPSN